MITAPKKLSYLAVENIFWMRIGSLLGSLRIIKSKGPKPFSYTPIYYDEEKERIEERRKILAETAKKEAKLTETQKEALRELNSYEWRRPIYRRQSTFRSLRFFMILMALVILFAWFFIKYGM